MTQSRIQALVGQGWQVLIMTRQTDVQVEVWNLPSGRRYTRFLLFESLGFGYDILDQTLQSIAAEIDQDGPLKPFEISFPVNQVALREAVPAELPEGQQTLGAWVSFYRRTIAPIHGDPGLEWFADKMMKNYAWSSEDLSTLIKSGSTVDTQLSLIERGVVAPTVAWLDAFCKTYKVSPERRAMLFEKREAMLRSQG
jgi:hypothetical protein